MNTPTLPSDDTVPNDFRRLRPPPYIGPHTGQQLAALDVLEEIARAQAEPVTAVLPPYTGPVTGDQLGLLGTGERYALEGAEREMAPQGRARHAKAGIIPRRLAARLASFSVIGVVVLVAGLIVQAALVKAGAGFYGSYAGQAVISIELSWLLNDAFTWRDRGVPWLESCWRFTAQKALLTIPNLALYAVAGKLGAGWLAANLLTTVVFTVVNYIGGDRWAFSARRPAPERPVPFRPALRYPLPSASVVVPCKSNEKTILATVESLLGQDYPGLIEVICVGDVGDPTWAALAGVTDPRLILLEQEKTPGRRDPNVKRDKGIRKSSGDVIALADSDIVMDADWLSKSVALLQEQGGGLVGGGMRAIRPHKFWPRFVDRNALAAKTSRIPQSYSVTPENFGARGRKPPITANAVITREAYEQCPLDVTWAYGYEDYEWMHRLAADGQTITMSPDLAGAHHHREKFAHLVREYRRSAHGCAQFVRRHPGSALAGKRRAQALGIPLAAVAMIAALAAAAADGHALAALALIAGALAVLSGREALRSRSIEAAAYPAAALALGGVFAWTLTASLLKPRADRPAPVWDSEGDGEPRRWEAVGTQRRPWPLMLLLAVQAAVSGALVLANTAFSDESLYLWAGHAERSGVAASKFAKYFSGAPQIYPLLSSALPGLTAARLASLVMMLAVTVMAWRTARLATGSILPAYGAAAVWALSEPALRMGAFATFDPLAIFLTCGAIWLGVESAYRDHHGELVAASALCAAAGALTAYSYLLYLPAIVAVTATVCAGRRGRRSAMITAAWQAIAAAAAFMLGATGLKVWGGFFFTTVSRSSSDRQSLGAVAGTIWLDAGLILILAAIAAVSATRRRRAFAVAAALGAFMVPVYQAFDAQTGWSMDKHLAPGMFCAGLAIAAGCADIRLARKQVTWLAGACAALLAAFAPQAASVQSGWPGTSALIAAVRPLAAAASGVGETNTPPPVLEYYTMPTSLGRLTWDNSLAATPPGPQGDWESAYRQELGAEAPSIVVLGYSGKTPVAQLPQLLSDAARGETSGLSSAIGQATGEPGLYALTLALLSDPSYRQVATGAYDSGWSYGYTPGTYIIWKRVTPPAASPVGRHTRRAA